MANGSHIQQSRAALTLLALGVVFGDIGTSPLYAVKETFSPAHGIALTTANILGGLSTIFWALMIVVSFKYVLLIMRADNRGEGGIMALTALASAAVKGDPRRRGIIFTLGLLGAALFFGDAVLTPAISVLSAVEGLEIGTSARNQSMQIGPNSAPTTAVPLRWNRNSAISTPTEIGTT